MNRISASALMILLLPAGAQALSPPVISKLFGQSPILVGQTTPLTFTISVPDGPFGLTGIGFTDNLPAGLLVATPNGLSGGCGGGIITATAGSGVISLSGAEISANATCSFSVNILATSVGSFPNSTSAVASAIGPGNVATDTLVVGPARTPLPPAISKFFAQSAILPNQTTRLNFFLTNPNPALVLSGVGFSDALPAGLLVAAPSGLSGGCGGGMITATAGSGVISLSGATLPPNVTCSFSVNVQTSTAGSFLNTTTPVTSIEGGPGNEARDTLLVVTNAAPSVPVISKLFGQSPILVGQTTPLTFTISVPDGPAGLTGIGFTDNLPAGLLVATPNGLSGGCGGGIITATSGSGVISLSGAQISANATCSFSVNILATSTGSFLNSTGPLSSVLGAANIAKDLLLVAPARTAQPPVIFKFFGQSGIRPNQLTRLNFILTNPNSALVLSGVGFSDTLPVGLAVAAPAGLSGGCGGGTITANDGSGVVSLAGATLAPNTTCSFSVNVQPSAGGSFLNTTTPVTSIEGGTGNAARDILRVVTTFAPSVPRLDKLFGQSPILVGQTTPLTFTISIPNATNGLTGLGFSDTLPAGLVVATPNGLSGGCGGGIITATSGSGVISLSGAEINANATCTFSVNILATSTGSFLNSTGSLTSVLGAANLAQDLLLVGPARTPQPPVISKFFAQSAVLPGQTTHLNFVLTNPNPLLALTGVGFSDTLPAGLVVATPNGFSGGCGGGTITANAGSGVISLSGATLGAYAACTFGVNVLASTVGTFLNTTTAVTSIEGGTGNAARDILAVKAPNVIGFPPPSITKQFGQSPILAGQVTPLTFTIVAGGGTTTSFTDTLPAGLVIATPNGLSGGCAGGVITATAGSGVVSLSGAAMGANTTCSFSVNVLTTTPGMFLNAVGVSGGLLGPGNIAQDLLLVVPLRAPIISKSFGAASIDLNYSTNLTFTLTNPNPTVVLAGVTFNDTLPAGLAVATPSSLPNGNCGGTITGSGSNIMASAITLATSSSCTFSVNVVGVTDGLFTNTTSTVTSTNGGTGNAATAVITVVPIIDRTGAYQVRYLANLNQGDSYVSFTNAGTLNGFDPAGRICVNVYAFDPAEELISCCACPVTPNGLTTISARNDLISNTLTPGVPTSITVKLLANAPAGGVCNATTPTASNIVRGMRSWATTIHLNTAALPAPGVFQETETPFSNAELSVSELSKLTSFCGFIQANGSGFGICRSCRAGALGSNQK